MIENFTFERNKFSLELFSCLRNSNPIKCVKDQGNQLPECLMFTKTHNKYLRNVSLLEIISDLISDRNYSIIMILLFVRSKYM